MASRKRIYGIALTLILISVIGFIYLGLEVSEEGTPWIDRVILNFFRNPIGKNDPAGGDWVRTIVRDIDGLGGFIPLTYFSLSLLFYLLFRHKGRSALLFSVTVAGGGGLSLLLKTIFARPRPDVLEHGSAVTSSFPSGHTMMSMIVYLTLGAVIAHLQPTRRLKITFVFQGVFLAFLIGVSRIYLGTHWPSDVLAGFLMGVAWTLSCWLVALWLQGKDILDGQIPLPGK